MNDFELSVNPVKTYSAPALPTFGDDNPTLLKKLPSRWQKNAKVIACIGLVGAFTLSGCNYPLSQNPMLNFITARASYTEDELVLRLHTGGSGSAFYVVHLTEQEAFGIIRARLEAAGLNLSDTPPTRMLDAIQRGGMNVRNLDLFDERRNVAVALIGWEEGNRQFTLWDRPRAAQLEESFADTVRSITVGAFYTPGRNVARRGETPVLEEIEEESRQILRQQLFARIDEFISFLQIEGILSSPHANITVKLNDTPLEFDMPPLTANHHTLVPARTVLEALGMNFSDSSISGFSAWKDDFSISFSLLFEVNIMVVNGERVPLDTPPTSRKGIMFAPLQAIVEATGASLEWDESTRTYNIITT